MKTKISLFNIILILALTLSSCAKHFDEPILTPPEYTPSKNDIVLSVKDFKAMYATLENNKNEQIIGPYVLKATVVANDVSGNIFKQIYVQDYNKANPEAEGMEGLYLGVDQNNVSGMYGVGQEVYINLNELYAVKYGNQIQIGEGTTNANRIPWEIFLQKVHRSNWANPSAVKPKKVKINELKPEMANTLVEFTDVEFVNAGTGLFIQAGSQYTEQAIDDGTGRVIIRTSEYFSALKNITLPKGKGTITGILGRYFDTWQVILRDINDIGTFSENDNNTGTTPTTPTEKTVFKETFGEPTKVDNKWPLVATYDKFDMKSPIIYSDASGKTDIRITSSNGAVWFPASKDDSVDRYLTISGISTKELTNAVLSFELAANVYDAGSSIDLSVVKVKVNGTTMTFQGKVVTQANGDANKFYPFTIENLPIADNITIEFATDATNTLGIRLDNVVIKEKSSN